MSNFAVMDGNKVINIIVALNKSEAEYITGFTCIESTNDNPASINGIYDQGRFINQQTVIDETPMTDEEKIEMWGSLTPPPIPDSV